MTTFAKTDIADVDNVNIEAILPLVTPAELKNELPLSPKAIETVTKGRETVRDILDGKDKRLLMVIGPCSIHDVNAAHEYADKLLALSKEIEDSIYVVMRVYFEKPRTTVGWKGLPSRIAAVSCLSSSMARAPAPEAAW